jgi:sugar phosphate permease
LINSNYQDNLSAISFMDAVRIPNVISYAFAFGFFKLINYAMFFWLPYFLAINFSPEQSNMISVLYDVGMMPGGIIVGTVSDWYGGRRACVIATFMCILAPLLFVFSQYSSVLSAAYLLPMLGLMGILVGGPNNIITSAVAADLAEHPSIRGNSKALGTVTGIINGSGSVTAALGLLLIGPIQVNWGWTWVWYFLIFCTVVGTLCMSPRVYRELYYHDAPDAAPAARPANYQMTQRSADSKA